jgi:hypothetical protein
MKMSHFTKSQSIATLKHAQGGSAVTGQCREHGTDNATFLKWHAAISMDSKSLIDRQ